MVEFRTVLQNLDRILGNIVQAATSFYLKNWRTVGCILAVLKQI